MGVVKAVRAPVPPAFFRRVLGAAAARPEVARRLADAAPAGAAGRLRLSLTVRVTGDRELRRLNRRFLGEDRATDVLAFPAAGWPIPDGYLGDLALSWPAVERQAAARGHPANAEAALLAVHGFLHLLGWDHATTEQERAMSALTTACLTPVGPPPGEGAGWGGGSGPP